MLIDQGLSFDKICTFYAEEKENVKSRLTLLHPAKPLVLYVHGDSYTKMSIFSQDLRLTFFKKICQKYEIFLSRTFRLNENCCQTINCTSLKMVSN